MNKRNKIYIAVLCVCCALDVVAFVLSFCLNGFFGVLSEDRCTMYEAKVLYITASDADMVHISVVNARISDDDETNDGASVSCSVLVAKHDMVEGKEKLLTQGTSIVFLVEEGELSEGGEVTAVALKIPATNAAGEEIVAALDLHDKEKLEKVRNTQIGLLCGVLVLLGVGGFCMYMLVSKRARW